MQLQVRLMREQLQMRKQKMINELRDLRKEYKLQEKVKATNDLAEGFSTIGPGRMRFNETSDQQSNMSVGFGNTQRMTKGKTLGIESSAIASTHFNSKKRNSRINYNTMFKSPPERSRG